MSLQKHYPQTMYKISRLEQWCFQRFFFFISQGATQGPISEYSFPAGFSMLFPKTNIKKIPVPPTKNSGGFVYLGGGLGC